MRAVSDLLVKELRYAGYRALVAWVNGGPPQGFYAVEVQNGAGGYGSDILRIQYGSEDKLARILQVPPGTTRMRTPPSTRWADSSPATSPSSAARAAS